MSARIPQGAGLHSDLIALLDASRQETTDTQLRMERQVQAVESQFLQERTERSLLQGRLTEETKRANQLQLDLIREQKKTEDLLNQIQAMKQKEEALAGELDHEKAIQEDLQRRLKSAEARIETLNQHLAEIAKAALLQNQLAESAKKYKAAQRRALFLLPCKLMLQTGASSGAAWVGFMMAGPIGAVIGNMAGFLGATVATQDAIQE